MSIRFRNNSIYSTELRVNGFKKINELRQIKETGADGKDKFTFKDVPYTGAEKRDRIVQCWMPGFDYLVVQSLTGANLIVNKDDPDLLRMGKNLDLERLFDELAAKLSYNDDRIGKLDINGMRLVTDDKQVMLLQLGNSFNVNFAKRDGSPISWMLKHSNDGFIPIYQMALTPELWNQGMDRLLHNAFEQIITFIDQYHMMLINLKFSPLAKFISSSKNNPYFQSVSMIISLYLSLNQQKKIPAQLVSLFAVGEYASILSSAMALVSSTIFNQELISNVRNSLKIDVWKTNIPGKTALVRRSLQGFDPYGFRRSTQIDRLLFGFIKTNVKLQRAKSFVSQGSIFDSSKSDLTSSTSNVADISSTTSEKQTYKQTLVNKPSTPVKQTIAPQDTKHIEAVDDDDEIDIS